jgi:hypothetical protein
MKPKLTKMKNTGYSMTQICQIKFKLNRSFILVAVTCSRSLRGYRTVMCRFTVPWSSVRWPVTASFMTPQRSPNCSFYTLSSTPAFISPLSSFVPAFLGVYTQYLENLHSPGRGISFPVNAKKLSTHPHHPYISRLPHIILSKRLTCNFRLLQ